MFVGVHIIIFSPFCILPLFVMLNEEEEEEQNKKKIGFKILFLLYGLEG